MNEFQSLPEAPETPQPIAAESLAQKSWLMRPGFLGQTPLMLAVCLLIIGFGGWYALKPDSGDANVSQLAFGGTGSAAPSFQPVTGASTVKPVPPVKTEPATINAVPDDVMSLINEGKSFSGANREAITRLSDTVRAQTTALAALQKQMAVLTTENATLVNRLTVLESRPVPRLNAEEHVYGSHRTRPSAVSGMHLESIQGDMAWVSWQGKTWAVQEGMHLGPVVIDDINAAQRQVMTSAGPLR
ncbi:conjugal transfer protein TraP [Pantoea ananatis 15320]|uniref:conjugal transfer protein TraP n=1 Tax=Pantoea ananas TaxID=553 RepID=UPI000420B926|nr:conjugal transfer protein TraP [Pantoea ananatis]PKC36282.1 conjugal transfer protein TraP [Pantoea ananatis 15320]